MIITLAGTVTHKNAHSAVIETQGVGYLVAMHPAALAELTVGATVRLWTHEHIREDARDLYGFADRIEHDLFLKLLSISGVGPKMAMNMLTLGTVAAIEKMIERADVDALCGVPGVGRKTAQKIVLELKGKLALDGAGGTEDELVSALIGLGYQRDAARDAAGRVTDGPVEQRLKAAIKELGRKVNA
jgi:holliday junction DNA helicase RuvA